MAMGKNKRSPLSQAMANPVPYKEPEQEPTMEIRRAKNGGYIVSMVGKTGYSSRKEHVYPKLSGLLSCVREHFGESKDEGGEDKAEE